MSGTDVNVIKARRFGPEGRPAVVKRNEWLAFRQAKDILEDAQRAAQATIAEARLQAEAILISAEQKGYENGGRQWSEALETAWKSRDAYLEANESALLQLAVRVAEKLVAQQLCLRPETIGGIVKEALRSASRAKKYSIQVHPADAVLVTERLSTLGNSNSPTHDIEVVSNAAMSRGDCVIESDVGVVDARLATQFANIERALSLKMSL